MLRYTIFISYGPDPVNGTYPHLAPLLHEAESDEEIIRTAEIIAGFALASCAKQIDIKILKDSSATPFHAISRS